MKISLCASVISIRSLSIIPQEFRPHFGKLSTRAFHIFRRCVSISSHTLGLNIDEYKKSIGFFVADVHTYSILIFTRLPEIPCNIFARFSSYSPLAFGVRFCFARDDIRAVCFLFDVFPRVFSPPNFPRINNGPVKIYGSINGEQTTLNASSFGRYWQQWARENINRPRI